MSVEAVFDAEVVRTADEWATVIKADLSSAVEGIVAAGQHLIAAKADVQHGQWLPLLKAIGISDSYARKLMTVAGNLAISNRSHGNDLPSAFRPLYELSRLPAEEIEDHIESGVITPDMTTAQARGLVEREEFSHTRTGADGIAQPASKPPRAEIELDRPCRDCDGNGCETCFPEDEPATDEQIAVMAEMSDDEFEAALAAARADGDLSAGNVIKHGQQADDLQSDEVPQRKSPEPPITKSFSTANYRLTLAVKAVVRLSENDRFKKNKDQISGCHLSDLIRARDALTGVIQQLEG
ncbi:hypothetical protein [Mycobacteroides abscessus]|uniref:hypothetical protein n=1 Tax=Mycobacteroides abscessus TaxID=36809 RepID=UPI00266CFFEB|nr:hypothetical protein [Mycobacteroides abscessus]MDO3331571.1 hypothetical protein [Mycobacteroides abscessus subsp. abscessus]